MATNTQDPSSLQSNIAPSGVVQADPIGDPATAKGGSPWQTETVVVSPERVMYNAPQPQPGQFAPNVSVPVSAGQPPRANPIGKFLLTIIFLALLGAGGWYAYTHFLPKTGGGTTGQITLQYWGLWEQDPNLRSVISEYETAHPNVTVQYTMQSPIQYRERLQAAIERGEGPDVFRFHNTWVPMIARDLAVVPVTVMTPQEFLSSFYQVASNDLVAGSAIYGIPMMIDGLGLYINEDLLASAGVAPPVTWTDVMNIVPALTAKSGNTITTSAIALGTANNVEHFSDILGIMFLQNGAKLTTLAGSEAEETMIFYHKFADPVDPLYTWNDTMDNSVSAFASGRVAMILAPSWRAHDIQQLNPTLKFHIAPIPQLVGNTVNWASYWVEGVSAKSKYPAAAWEFVKYMTSAQTTTKLYTETAKTRLFGEPYARVELASTIVNDPYAGAYIKQALTAHSFPLASRTFDNGINDKLIKYLEDAVNSVSTGNSPSKALGTAAAGFKQALGTYGISVGPYVTGEPAQLQQ
jgi:multiple sugar transport system substrate-binding protein